MEHLLNMPKATPSVFILYTGGTIGSRLLPDGGGLGPVNTQEFREELLTIPGFDKQVVTVNVDDGHPETKVRYDVHALTPAIDSSSMTPAGWLQIANATLLHLQAHDGVVILHGTDTMAYTSSALAFLLSGTPKPIVVTGSQIPLAYGRNDASENLMASIAVAATSRIPGVVVAFSDRIMAGPRAVKVNADTFTGFDSPNYPCIGHIGIGLTYEPRLELPIPDPTISITEPTNFDARKKLFNDFGKSFQQFSVVVIKLYPGIQHSTVNAMLTGTTPPVKGVCIEAYGSGNAPADVELMTAFQHAHEKGAVLVDVTQVLAGTVSLYQYAAAHGLAAAGVISGRNMTTEACYAKLIYLTARGFSQTEIEEYFRVDMVGEVTVEKPARL